MILTRDIIFDFVRSLKRLRLFDTADLWETIYSNKYKNFMASLNIRNNFDDEDTPHR